MHRVFLGLTIAMCASCALDEPNRGESVSGVYFLRTVNGSPLPATTSGDVANKTELLDDTFTLYDGFTYAELAHVRVTVNGITTTSAFTESGSFGTQGTSLTFRAAGTLVDRLATYSSNALTFIEAGKTSVYKK
ncbi:MAG: hypothetical protein ABJC26_18110 [Gemmatimonadaceae bacterium]